MNQTIAIKEETKEALKGLRICPTETFDNVIQRLLKNESK